MVQSYSVIGPVTSKLWEFSDYRSRIGKVGFPLLDKRSHSFDSIVLFSGLLEYLGYS